MNPLQNFDARYNNWGSRSGPKGSSLGGQGSGKGDIVSKNIAYEPYLTCPNIVFCQSNPLTANCFGANSLSDEASNTCVEDATKCPSEFYGNYETGLCSSDSTCTKKIDTTTNTCTL